MVLDAAVGYIMEKVDLVIVGVKGAVENWEIINKIGTNQMAVYAKAQNKSFYVVTKSFKFVQHFPLNQQAILGKFKFKAATPQYVWTGQDLKEIHPRVDCTTGAEAPQQSAMISSSCIRNHMTLSCLTKLM